MKKTLWLFLGVSILCACQPRANPVTVLDRGEVYSLSTTKTVPAEILAQANIAFGANDRLMYLGSRLPLDDNLPDRNNITITVRHAVTITLITPNNQQLIQSSALSVGDVLAEAGYQLYSSDWIDPPADTPIIGAMNVFYKPAHEIVITADNFPIRVRSAADEVGQALAEAGIPLVGLDRSIPVESEALPADGKIRVLRVVESVALSQKTIPFATRTELSADLEIDHQALLQGGEVGLAIARLRTRSEDGVQVSQKSESETVVRPPQDSIFGIGTKIVIRTTTVDGETIEYWRTLQLYATSYSPCRLGTGDNRCSYGSSSGMRAGKGVVAMQYYWYLLFGFEHLYVPGYGYAVVGDVGGVNLTSHYWIDLGYNDNDYVPWSSPVTVYFLTPVPANPGYILP